MLWWIAASWCHPTRLSSVCLFVSLPNRMRKPLTFLDNLVHQFMMEEELTRDHPHCLAIHTKDKRQKPLKRISICELSFDFRSVVCMTGRACHAFQKQTKCSQKYQNYLGYSQGSLLVSHGLPIAESWNKLKTLVWKNSLQQGIFLTELFVGIRDTCRTPLIDRFVCRNQFKLNYILTKLLMTYRKHVLLGKLTVALL